MGQEQGRGDVPTLEDGESGLVFQPVLIDADETIKRPASERRRGVYALYQESPIPRQQ